MQRSSDAFAFTDCIHEGILTSADDEWHIDPAMEMRMAAATSRPRVRRCRPTEPSHRRALCRAGNEDWARESPDFPRDGPAGAMRFLGKCRAVQPRGPATLKPAR
jgi:hypothetical protein